MSERTAYEAIGDVRLRETVNLFYDNLLGDTSIDPPVSRHFKDMTNSRLAVVRYRTGTLIGRLLGAPGEGNVIGEDDTPLQMMRLRAVHQRIDITQQDFDVTVGHLVRAFQTLPEGEIAVQALTPYVEPLQGILVKPQPPAGTL